MGYETSFKLKVDSEIDLEKLGERIAEISTYDWWDLCVDGGGDYLTMEAKWYDHYDDMVTLSKEYKDSIFTLNGSGEESEDIWVKFFKNGKGQTEYATLVLGEFDESKLK